MLVVETIAKIMRAYFIGGKSIKQICREFSDIVQHGSLGH